MTGTSVLTSELSTELAALIRQLQNRILTEPELLRAEDEPRDHLDRAIIALIKLRIELDR